MNTSQRRTSVHRIWVGKDVHKFSCAHMTVFPDGSKERLHGHNFQVAIGLDLLSIAPADFVDFALVKRALQAECDALTEHLLLAARSRQLSIIRHDEQELEFTLCGRRYVIPADEAVLLPVDNIVVEVLAQHLAQRLATRLGATLRPDVVAGMAVTVTESGGQGGEFSVSITP